MNRDIRFGQWRFYPDTLVLVLGDAAEHLEPRVARLLTCFLEHRGEVLSHDLLIEEVWEGRVVSDDAVRRAVSVLRQTLARHDSKDLIRTLHKKGYVADFPPPDAALSKVAPATQTAPPDVNTHATQTPPDRLPPHRLLRLTAALAIALALLTGVWWWSTQPDESPRSPATQTRQTLAVLPFVDLSEDQSNQYFTDGLAEELIGRLAQLDALQVTARSSSFQFRDAQRDLQEVGEKLGVAHVIEGSVRRDGERVRINAALVDTATGTRRWSQTYDRTLADFFALQEEIAVAVARALQVVLVRAHGPENQTSSTAALQAYLRGRAMLTTMEASDAARAIHQFQQAIALDPGYAAPYAQLASAMMIRDNAGGPEMDREKIDALLDRALELNPDLAEAHIVRARMLWHDSPDPEVAETAMRRALELNPSYSAGYEALAIQRGARGLFEEAFTLIDQAIALDPLRPRNLHAKAILHFWRGDFDAAEALELETLRLEPRYLMAYARLGFINIFRGDFARGVVYMEKAVALSPVAGAHDSLAFALMCIGESNRAREESRKGSWRSQLPISLFDGVSPDPATFDWQAQDMVDHYSSPLVTDAVLRAALDSTDYARLWQFIDEQFDAATILAGPATSQFDRGYLNLALLRYLAEPNKSNLTMVRELSQQTDTEGSPLTFLDTQDIIYGRAVAAAVLGENERALAELQKILGSGRSHWWWRVRGHPAFAALREDTQLQSLLSMNEVHARQEQELLRELHQRDLKPGASE
jgi:TolB-like protein/DNA-binding winged helix-turn-helix (wHTH) protein